MYAYLLNLRLLMSVNEIFKAAIFRFMIIALSTKIKEPNTRIDQNYGRIILDFAFRLMSRSGELQWISRRLDIFFHSFSR